MQKITFRKNESPRMFDVFRNGEKVGEFYYERTRQITKNAQGSRILNVKTYGRIWDMQRTSEDISFCATFIEARQYAVRKFQTQGE